MALATVTPAKTASGLQRQVMELATVAASRDALATKLKSSVKELKLQKRVQRGTATVAAIVGGAGAGAADAIMGDNNSIDLFGVDVPVVALASAGARVAVEFLDPDAEGTGMVSSALDGALGYSAGTAMRKVVEKWY